MPVLCRTVKILDRYQVLEAPSAAWRARRAGGIAAARRSWRDDADFRQWVLEAEPGSIKPIAREGK
jgi:hypothetical protein